jgi:hypothetical protein
VLAGQAPGQVASRCGLSADAVDAFERLFFDVRDRLDAPDYIALVAIGPRLYDDATAGDPDIVLRLYGYNYGPLAVDAVLDALGGTPAASPEEDYRRRVVHAALAARSLPADPANAPALLRLVRHYDLLRDEEGDGPHAVIAGPVRPAIAISEVIAIVAGRSVPALPGGERVDRDDIGPPAVVALGPAALERSAPARAACG